MSVTRAWPVATVLAMAVLMSSTAMSMETTMLEITSKDDLIDVTKNPGCGVKLGTDEEKLARSIRMAKFYLQGYIELPKTNLNHDLDTFHCYAKTATALGGTFDPPPAISKPRDPKIEAWSGSNFAQHEAKAWQKVVPDIRFERGASRIIAWPNGNFTSYLNVGTAKTGEKVQFWELCVMLIDDDGLITHIEFWDDTQNIDKALQLVLGKKLSELQKLATYSSAVEEKAAH